MGSLFTPNIKNSQSEAILIIKYLKNLTEIKKFVTEIMEITDSL